MLLPVPFKSNTVNSFWYTIEHSFAADKASFKNPIAPQLLDPFWPT
jgi:hypothetical protein